MRYYFKRFFVLHSLEVIFSFLIKKSRQKAIEIETAIFHPLGNPKGRTLDNFFYASRGGQVHVKTVSHVCHKMAVFGKKIKPGVSQNTGYFYIWLISFDPSNFKATSCSIAVTRQGNELLAYDCHQLTLFPRRISSHPKNF